jgi:NAD(P)-dependent dehydrogenase (short-subunit alcohol dehydrogenase family)
MRVDPNRGDRRVIVVTGASQGLGRRMAEALADDGSHIVLTGRAGPDSPLESVAAGIVAAGGRATAVHGDVADETDVQALAKTVLDTFGHVDVLVNNAAVRLSSRLLDTTAAEMDHIFGVNVRGPFLMWRYLVPAMVARGRGNVINISSTNAPVQPFFGMAPYRMTKAALTFLSVDLASEVRDDGVAVNAFDPGAVVSEGTAAIRRERSERYGVTVPYHPQDALDVLDKPIRWLADQTADTFTGQFVRRVDFGRTWGPTDRA